MVDDPLRIFSAESLGGLDVPPSELEVWRKINEQITKVIEREAIHPASAQMIHRVANDTQITATVMVLFVERSRPNRPY